jgi:hypothetical protein
MSVASSGSRINDFVIKIATVNGTGSASANTLLMKSIFRSGIPGKTTSPRISRGYRLGTRFAYQKMATSRAPEKSTSWWR